MTLDLPNNWTTCTLGDFLYLKNGFAFKSKDYISKSDKTVPIIRISDLDGAYANNFNAAHIDKNKKVTGFEINKGDLLLAMSGATTGKIGIYIGDQIAYQNQRVGNIKFYSDKDSVAQYRNYLIASLSEKILKAAYGGAQPNISAKSFEGLEINFAPIAEQKAIAEKLDSLLAQVEATKTRLEGIPDILKQFRQSVLAAAVSGELTEDWRVSNEKYLPVEAEDWKWSEIPKEWNVDSYENLVNSRLGKMLDKEKNTGLPTKYLGNVNVRWFEFDLNNLQEILVSDQERKELALQQGDVLICEGGEPGRCAVWNNDSSELVIFQKALHRARVSSHLIPEWLAINLKNDADRLTLAQLFTGTTIKHLTGKALKKYPLRIPPIEEQVEIVQRVEELFTFADHIETKAKTALASVNHLTQSILAQAFSGELTKDWRQQNPDLISGENSAEALLERIKAERETLKPAKKTRQKRG